MTRPVQHRSHTLTQTADGNWSWWGSKGGAHMPTPSVDTYGCTDQLTYILRESVWLSVCVALYVCWHAHWTKDDLLTGDSMEHIEEETYSVGPSPSSQRQTLGSLPPPLMSSAGALYSWRQAPHTLCIKPGCRASSPASFPHEWLPYCHILYRYCWQVTQSYWLVVGELTIAEGGRMPVNVGCKALMVHILKGTFIITWDLFSCSFGHYI